MAPGIAVPWADAAGASSDAEAHGQTDATTIAVPVAPGLGAYAEPLVSTITMPLRLPVIALPLPVTELLTIAAIHRGMVAGGPALLPGPLVQSPPHAVGCTVLDSNPLNAPGAGPPLIGLA